MWKEGYNTKSKTRDIQFKNPDVVYTPRETDRHKGTHR